MISKRVQRKAVYTVGLSKHGCVVKRLRYCLMLFLEAGEWPLRNLGLSFQQTESRGGVKVGKNFYTDTGKSVFVPRHKDFKDRLKHLKSRLYI